MSDVYLQLKDNEELLEYLTYQSLTNPTEEYILWVEDGKSYGGNKKYRADLLKRGREIAAIKGGRRLY